MPVNKKDYVLLFIDRRRFNCSWRCRARELFYYLKGGQVDYGEEHSKASGHKRFGRMYHTGRDSQEHNTWPWPSRDFFPTSSSYMAVLIWCRALSCVGRAQPGAFCRALCGCSGCEGAASDACRQGTQTRDFQFYSQVIAVYCCRWN